MFHWQENYIRCNAARLGIGIERRKYRAGVTPYDDPATRDQLLTEAVSRIEQEETTDWAKIAAERPKS